MIKDDKFKFENNILYEYIEESGLYVELFRVIKMTEEEATQAAKEMGLL